ncbi:MAG: DUF4360 domain-containing protein [Bdellovibrionales bacterium]|nr:DUF4360 domain-containing protein [Bdellovibrionales bacterium]
MKYKLLPLLLICSMMSLKSWGQDLDDGMLEPHDQSPIGNERSEVNRMVSMSTPKFAGGGCDPSSSSAALSEDKKTLSILLSDFVVEAGESIGMFRNRKICKVEVPLNVPNGMQMAIVKLDYRGFNSLVRGAYTQFSAVHYYDLGHGPNQTRVVRRKAEFAGPLEDEFYLSGVIKQRIPWSECGRDIDLNINMQMTTRSNRQNEDVFSSIDSLDMSSVESSYHLLWRRCENSGRSSGTSPVRLDPRTNPRVNPGQASRRTPPDARERSEEMNRGRAQAEEQRRERARQAERDRRRNR